MQKIIFVCLIIFFLTTCRKPSLGGGDYFIFGSSYSECEVNCIHYFMIKKDRLFADKMNKNPDKLKFKIQKLSEDKVNLAKQLVDRFPDYLKNSSSTTFGCPDCRDQGGYYIEIKENSKIKKFRIDTDTSEIPNDIKSYILDLESVLRQL